MLFLPVKQLHFQICGDRERLSKEEVAVQVIPASFTVHLPKRVCMSLGISLMNALQTLAREGRGPRKGRVRLDAEPGEENRRCRDEFSEHSGRESGKWRAPGPQEATGWR